MNRLRLIKTFFLSVQEFFPEFVGWLSDRIISILILWDSNYYTYKIMFAVSELGYFIGF